jgi:hypothetical protein
MSAGTGSELRNMLRAMQSGEMTVSRGVELLDMCLAGNYTDDQLPPVRNGLGEDETPWDRIDSLIQQRDELQGKWDYYQNFVKSHGAESITELVVQRDELLAAMKMIEHATEPSHDDGAYHENAYSIAVDAIAKVKPMIRGETKSLSRAPSNG